MLIPVVKKSDWDEAGIEAYLESTEFPVRLACNGREGFPLVCSVWFLYRAGSLWCVAHRNSELVRLLTADPRCGFEIATNTPPYSGVRGQGRVTLDPAAAADILPQLVWRYLKRDDTALGRWLLKRLDEEVAIRITPEWVTAWDYSRRMADTAQPAS